MKVRYAIGAMLVAALIALPAGAAAKKAGGPLQKLAAQQCKQERHQLGRKGFRKKYGAKHQMRNCIKRNRFRLQAAARSAAAECEAELAAIGWELFVEEYGSDDTGYDAMSECIADKLDEILYPEDDLEDADDGSEYGDEW